MIKIKALAAALALITALPMGASAGNEVTIYPYASSQNYCPAGLQPVSISGVICCGTPTTHVTYQLAKAHPVAPKRHYVTYRAPRAEANCPIGTKGCTFD